MKNKLLNYLMLGGSLITLSIAAQNQDKQNISETTLKQERIPKKVFKEEWPSIARHKTPEWFRDAKFGIYTHFGPAVLATQAQNYRMVGMGYV